MSMPLAVCLLAQVIFIWVLRKRDCRLKDAAAYAYGIYENTDNRVPNIIDDFGYRKLTVRECLGFQCFPENDSFPVGTTIQQAYAQIGNSVCAPLIRKIAEQIRKVLEDNDDLQ